MLAGKYDFTYVKSGNVRTLPGGFTKPLFNVTITDTETDTTIEVDDVVEVFEREDWLDTIYTNSKRACDNPDDDACCYKTARYV
jgi:hypothetical protein